MKIAFVVSMKYGLTSFIFRDIEALVNKGHKIDIFTLHNQQGLYMPKPEWPLYDVNRVRLLTRNLITFIKRPRTYLQLLNKARQTNTITDFVIAVLFAEDMEQTNLLYAYFGDHKLFVAYYVKLLTGIPLLTTIRAYELYDNPNPKFFVEVLANCDQILTINEHNRRYLVDNYDAPDDHIQIVRQIIDLETFKYRPKIKILIVAFFSPKKGHDTLLKALKKMNRDDIEIWVVGDIVPSRSIPVRQLTKDFGLEDQVAFFGVQKGVALRALFRECDVFCLPSRIGERGDREGFPNAIAEAMAYNKPVVSTRHAGIPEVVEDAYLVDENDFEALADLLTKVCDSEELQQQIGQRNRTTVEKMFSSRNNDTLEAIFKQFAK